MKRIMVVLMVLSMASIANAGLWLSVNGQVNPPEVLMLPSSTAQISIFSDGMTTDRYDLYMRIIGPAFVDITHATNAIYPPGYPDSIRIADWEGHEGDIWMDVVLPIEPPPFPYGTIIDNLILHCESAGDVTLMVLGEDSGDTTIFDTQVIHGGDVPEPMTMGLLGLGGLFLCRRR